MWNCGGVCSFSTNKKKLVHPRSEAEGGTAFLLPPILRVTFNSTVIRRGGQGFSGVAFKDPIFKGRWVIILQLIRGKSAIDFLRGKGAPSHGPQEIAPSALRQKAKPAKAKTTAAGKILVYAANGSGQIPPGWKTFRCCSYTVSRRLELKAIWTAKRNDFSTKNGMASARHER